MKRVTENDLQAIVTRINKITKSPLSTYTRTIDDKYLANIGNYHLDFAYGGVALHRIESVDGGVSDVFRCGHVSKRELQKILFAFIEGLQQTNKMEIEEARNVLG